MRPSDEFYRAIRLSNIAEVLTRARHGVDVVRTEMSRAGRAPRPPMRDGFLRRRRDAGELEHALTLTETELESDDRRLRDLLRDRGVDVGPLPRSYVPADTNGDGSELALLDALEARARALEARTAAHVDRLRGLRGDASRRRV